MGHVDVSKSLPSAPVAASVGSRMPKLARDSHMTRSSAFLRDSIANLGDAAGAVLVDVQLPMTFDDIPPSAFADVPPGYMDAINQVSKRGWARMKWANNFSLLHWAARGGRTALCGYFLSCGADPCAVDDFNRSAIDYARRKKHPYVLRLFDRF